MWLAHLEKGQAWLPHPSDAGAPGNLLYAADPKEPVTIQRFAHGVGQCHMATRPEDGVVHRDLRVFP